MTQIIFHPIMLRPTWEPLWKPCDCSKCVNRRYPFVYYEHERIAIRRSWQRTARAPYGETDFIQTPPWALMLGIGSALKAIVMEEEYLAIRQNWWREARLGRKVRVALTPEATHPERPG